MKRFFTLLLFVLGGLFKGHAQTYPVQATTQLLPPYSLFLADYVSAGSERLTLNVYLADIARPSLDVRFRLRIVGQGITLETKAEYRPAPVQLQGGVPLRLVSTDLADYFNPNNLNFQGMSRTEFNRTGKLPEGAYQFCFEVLEYNRGVKISGTACAMAWLILNDPPIINLPANNVKLKAQDPQNVLLQWTPRHTGSPNAAFNTEYDVRMVEVWPATRNPNDAVLSSPAIFETTTTSTTVIYGPAETPLEPGRRYAFRVRARGLAGLDEMDLFKNNGYSEVFTFVYGDPCDLPTGISINAVSSTRFSLAWDGLFNHTGFRVRYRQLGTTNWYENRVTLNSSEINGLKPGTTYEYQVAATCGFYDGQYAAVARVTTEKAPETEYACGVPLNPFNLDPAQLAGSLKVGDIIDAGDFDVKLTKVSGSNGTFSGEGVIEVPYFNRAKVKTEFTSITVNKDLRMVNGYLNVTGAGVDVIPQGLTDFIEDLNETLDVIDSALNTIEENLPESFDPNSFVPDTLIDVKDGIHSVYKNDDGSVVIVDKSGNTQTLPPGTAAAIKDDNGKGFLVDKKGNIHPTTSDIAAKAGNRQLNLLLTFARNSEMRYGLDKKPHPMLANGYEELKGGYPVLWKSIAAGETDVVTAMLGDATFDKTKVKFEMGGSPVSASPADGQSLKVLIQGMSEGEQGLLATYAATDTGKVQVLGKLNVATYAKIKHDVVIVPVNMEGLPYGMTDKFIQDSLNATYGQGVVSWTVTVQNSLQVSLASAFDDGGTGLLSNYTSDMKKVINAYGSLDDEKYYLFLITSPQSGRTQGYMPRGKSAGFIFVNTNPDKNEMVRTMAHELGHGAFNLHHIFDEPNFKITKGATDNLMDYPAGPRLYKFQWDKMRFPDIVIGLFEDDQDAELSSQVVMLQEEPDEATTTTECLDISYFMAPNGKLFTLKGTPYVSVGVASLGSTRTKYFVDCIRDDKGVKYYARIEDDKFLGYWLGTEREAPLTYAKDITKAKVILDYGDRCYYQYKCIANWVVPAEGTAVSEVVKSVEAETMGDSGLASPWAGRTAESPECQSILYLLDATAKSLPASVYQELKNLFDGDHENQLTGQRVRLKGKLVLTSSDPSVNQKAVTVKFVDGQDVLFFDGVAVSVPDDEVLFWLESEGTKLKVKQIFFGRYINERMQKGVAAWEAGVTWDQKNFWEKSASMGYMAIDTYFTAMYDLTDLMASGIEHLKLPPSVYDCNSKDPKTGKSNYNPYYAKVFSFLDITRLFRDLLFKEMVERYPQLNQLGGEPSQIEFAMFCGMYNGLIGVVKSVPEFVHMVLTPLTSKGRENFSKQFGQFAELEIKVLNPDGSVKSITCKKDEYMCKVWELVSDGVVKMFTEGGGCKVAANVGEIVGPIIVMCLGDAAAAEGVLAKVGGTVIRVIKWCDDFADVTRYMGAATTLVKNASGKLLMRISDQMGNMLEGLANGYYRARIYVRGEMQDLLVPEHQLAGLLDEFGTGQQINMHIEGGPNEPFWLFSQDGTVFSKAMQRVADDLSISVQLLNDFKRAGLSENTVRGMMDKLKALGKTNGYGKLLALFQNLPFDDAAAIRALVQDITDSPALLDMVENGAFNPSIWKELKDNGSRYVRRSVDDMARFARLSEDVRKYIAMFSDNDKVPSTLQKFLKDIEDDADFLSFVNDPANEKFIRGFVSHKANLSKAEAASVGELLAEVAHAQEKGKGVWPEKVSQWLDRSEGFTNFNRYSGLGTSLSNKIAASLRAKKGVLYDALKKKLNLPDVNGKSLLDEYELFTEVPLQTSGGFMKADIVLIKRNPETNQIVDVIVLENKLSKSTDYTPRQKEGFKEIGSQEVTTMHLEYEIDGLGANSLKVRKDRCFRVSDHGKDEIGGITGSDIVGVDYSKFK